MKSASKIFEFHLRLWLPWSEVYYPKKCVYLSKLTTND